jgi:hypothetical protein
VKLDWLDYLLLALMIVLSAVASGLQPLGLTH